MTQPNSQQSSRGAHLDYFGVRPACGCITAWLIADATDEEVTRFSRIMRASERDVIRGTFEEYHDRLEKCPHWELSLTTHSDYAGES